MRQISARELKDWLADESRPQPALLDVREPHEFAAYRIDGAQLMPMQSVPARLEELDRQRDIVMICHSGVRSHHAGLFLKQNGFERVHNLAGGVVAWAHEAETGAG